MAPEGTTDETEKVCPGIEVKRHVGSKLGRNLQELSYCRAILEGPAGDFNKASMNFPLHWVGKISRNSFDLSQQSYMLEGLCHLEILIEHNRVAYKGTVSGLGSQPALDWWHCPSKKQVHPQSSCAPGGKGGGPGQKYFCTAPAGLPGVVLPIEGRPGSRNPGLEDITIGWLHT